MTSLTQNFLNPNNKPLVLGGFSIRQDEDGRYCLNDLHKASGSDKKHQPAYFIRNQQTKDLIAEIEKPINGASANLQTPAVGKINDGVNNGTYVVKELVYSYAMWISAKFHLMVIRAYDALVMDWKINDRQTITPEQKDTLHKIIDHKVNGNQGLRAQVWTRHNRHFKINSYHELLKLHFEDSVKYLLEMEVKQKTEKPEIKSLPYPKEVIHVAHEINNEFLAGVLIVGLCRLKTVFYLLCHYRMVIILLM